MYNTIEFEPKNQQPDLTTSSLNMIPDVVRSRQKPKLNLIRDRRFNVMTRTNETNNTNVTEGNQSKVPSEFGGASIQLTDVDNPLESSTVEFKLRQPRRHNSSSQGNFEF